jgi:hypothetical protein
MSDVSLDRQLAHAYLDKLPPDKLAAVRSLLERILETPVPDFYREKGISLKDALGDLELTLEEFERLSLN